MILLLHKSLSTYSSNYIPIWSFIHFCWKHWMMKISIYVRLIFFVLGRLQEDDQVIKIKTVISTFKKTPAVLKAIKKIKKLPKKLPIKKPWSKLQRLALKNVLVIKDNLNPDTWGKVEESIGFFMKIGKFLKYRNISTYNLKVLVGWQEEEFMKLLQILLGLNVIVLVGLARLKKATNFANKRQ